jgi:tetratricopeptide (TPR) repeat protein
VCTALCLALGLLFVDKTHAAGLVKQPSPSTQAAPPTAPADNAPISAFAEYARAMFERQEYVAAAQCMERAYAKDKNPLWLFNIGQAYRKAGRYDEAMAAYQRLLDTAPQTSMAAETRDHVRTLKMMIKQDEQRKQIQLAMEQTQKELERLRKPPLYKRVWFWATLVGGAAAVVAVGVGAKYYQDQRASELGYVNLQF